MDPTQGSPIDFPQDGACPAPMLARGARAQTATKRKRVAAAAAPPSSPPSSLAAASAPTSSSPLRETRDAWVRAEPSAAASARVVRRVAGASGKWTARTADAAVHTARWKALRALVVCGDAASVSAGATTGVGSATGDHVITLHVGDGFDSAAQSAALRALRAAGVHEELYFTLDGQRDARLLAHAHATVASALDASPTPDAVPVPAPAPVPAPVPAPPPPEKRSVLVMAIDKDWDGAWYDVVRTLEQLVGSPLAAHAHVVYGDGKGAEGRVADQLRAAGVTVTQERAKWGFGGAGNRNAGKDRNRDVLTSYRPVAVCVFAASNPDERGNTATWTSSARSAGVRVHLHAHGSAHGAVGGPDALALAQASAPAPALAPASAQMQGLGQGQGQGQAAARVSGELDLSCITPAMLVGGGLSLACHTSPPWTRTHTHETHKHTRDSRSLHHSQGGYGTGSGSASGSGFGALIGLSAVTDSALLAAWGVKAPPSLPQSQFLPQSLPQSLPAGPVSGLSTCFTPAAGAQLERVGGTVCVCNPAAHALLPGPDDAPASAPPSAAPAPDSAACPDGDGDGDGDQEGDPDSDDASSSCSSAATWELEASCAEDERRDGNDARARAADTGDTEAFWTPQPKPRSEWLLPHEVRERFVDITEARALALARAQQGAATLTTTLAAPLVVPEVSDVVDAHVVSLGARVRDFEGKVVEIVMARGRAAFFHVVAVLDGERLRLSFTGWARDVIPRAGAVFPAGSTLKDESWIFGRLFACTGSVFGSAAGENPHEKPRRDADSDAIKPGLLEKKVWELDDDAEERERFRRNVTFGSKNEPHARESYTAFCLDEWLRAHYDAHGALDRFPAARAQSRVLEFGVLAMPGPQSWMRSSPDGVAVFLDVDGVFRMLFVEYKCPANLHSTDFHPYRKYPDNTPPYYKAQIQGGMGLLNEPAHAEQWRRVLALTIEQEVVAIARAAEVTSADTSADASADASAEAWARAAPRLLEALADPARAPSIIDMRFDRAHFVVWQRHQLWVTHAPYDDAYYRTFLLPRLRAWFEEFLAAMTHKFNGRLVRGEVAPLSPDLVGERLDADDPDADAKLAARVQRNLAAAEAARQHRAGLPGAARALPAWQSFHIAARLRALAAVYQAEGWAAARAACAAFARETDTAGRRKVDVLLHSVPRIQGELVRACATSPFCARARSSSRSRRSRNSNESESESEGEESDESDSERLETRSTLDSIVASLCVLLRRSDGAWSVEQLRYKSSQKLASDAELVSEWLLADVERALAAVWGE